MLRKIILTLEILFELFLVVIMAPYSIIEVINGGVDAALLSITTICFIFWLVITIAGFFRIKNKKTFVIITGLGMKLWVAFMGIGFIGFFDDALGMAIGFTLMGIFILVLLLVSSHCAKSQQNNTSSNADMKPYLFDHEKAEWSYDAAASEYAALKSKDISEFSDEERYLIYEYAGMYISYFILWLIKRDLISEDFKQLLGDDMISDIKAGKTLPTEALSCIDYVLSMDDCAPELKMFMTTYFMTRYFADYYLEIYNPEYITYCVDFSYETYNRIEKRIDEAYEYFNDYDDYDFWNEENVKQELFVPVFGQELGIYATDKVDNVYYEKCINHLQSFPVELLERMKKEVYAYAEGFDSDDELRVDLPATSLFKEKFGAGTVYILEPKGDEPAFIIGFESDYEPEHGLGFTVRGDVLLECSYRVDASSPWTKDNVEIYESVMQIRRGETVEVDEIAGAKNKAVNGKITLSRLAAKKKFEDEILIMMRIRNKMADSYECNCTYDGNNPIPRRISHTVYKDGRVVGYTTIHIW